MTTRTAADGPGSPLGREDRPRQLVPAVPAGRARQQVRWDLVRQRRPAGLAVPRPQADLVDRLHRALRTLCALRTCWTDRTGGTGLACGTSRTLRPRITAAPRQCKKREDGGHTQQVAHDICPSLTRGDVTITEPLGGNDISADKSLNSTNGAGFTALAALSLRKQSRLTSRLGTTKP